MVGTPSLPFLREPRPQGLHPSGPVQVSERTALKLPKPIREKVKDPGVNSYIVLHTVGSTNHQILFRAFFKMQMHGSKCRTTLNAVKK